ncbi:MAG TPA: ACT domain-containing protein [Thermoanaerobaculia bacterium]|nr:ACT domain-containing protein [Thermoanaerobaculia bacterium]
MPPALRLLPERYAVCRLDPGASFDPTLLEGEGLAVLARAPGELSLVCREDARPSVTAELGFRALGVVGPLDFSLVGVLAGLTGVLAAAEVPLFAISTYDTDYLLVRDADLACALEALGAAGYDVRD